jgi:hypothetical protein
MLMDMKSFAQFHLPFFVIFRGGRFWATADTIAEVRK